MTTAKNDRFSSLLRGCAEIFFLPGAANGALLLAIAMLNPRIALAGMISVLAAQEAERGAAARLWENTAMRALFARSAGEADGDLAQALSAASSETDRDFTWSALDFANAGLRRLLIALHVNVEARDDTARDREILELYADMARWRHLDLPGV